jgi:hypothetical protein
MGSSIRLFAKERNTSPLDCSHQGRPLGEACTSVQDVIKAQKYFLKDTINRRNPSQNVAISISRLQRRPRGTDLNDIHLIINRRHVTVNSGIRQYLAAIANIAGPLVKVMLSSAGRAANMVAPRGLILKSLLLCRRCTVFHPNKPVTWR